MMNNRKSIQDYKIEVFCLYSGSLCSLLNNIMINIKNFFCSVTKLCPTLCNPMNCRMASFPVLHYLPEFAQMHVHWVDDVIQPSHPLLPPSPPALNFSQHEGLLQWICPLQQVAKVLELQLQHQSFQWIFRVDFLKIVWFDILAVQETLKSLLQHHSLKALILWCSAFFMAQLSHPCTSLVAQMVKHLPTMQDTWVQSLGQEDLLGKEMATHSSTLAWKIPWTEELGRLQSTGSHRVGHDWSDLAAAAAQCGRPGFNPWVRKISWRRKWQPTPVFLPGKSHGQRNLVDYSPWGCKELDTT